MEARARPGRCEPSAAMSEIRTSEKELWLAQVIASTPASSGERLRQAQGHVEKLDATNRLAH